MLKMIRDMDILLESYKFDLDFHLGCLAWLTIFEPNTPVAYYGYKDST